MEKALLVLALGSACVTTVDDDALEVEQAVGCPKWGCGTNSSVTGPYQWHEGNTNGFPNAEGVRVMDYILNGVSYHPEIINGTELALFDHVGNLVVTGKNVENGYFRLSTPTGTYNLYVTHASPKNVSGVNYWVGPVTSVDTYELKYIGPGMDSALPVCANPPNRASGEGSGRVWARPLEAILFTGDRYDSNLKTVTASTFASTQGWFNIGCAGSALAKLHLTRHTTAGSTAGYFATAAQRQALLKMYVSDVCGTGSAWTQQGTPLHWTNTMGWSHLTGTEQSQEALWNSGGATCLDQHRLGNLYLASIVQECANAGHPLPACPQIPQDGMLPGNAYLLTAVP